MANQDADPDEAAVGGLPETVILVRPDHLRELIERVHRPVTKLAEQDLPGQVERAPRLDDQVVEKPATHLAGELGVGRALDLLKLPVEELDPVADLTGIAKVGVRLGKGGRGGEQLHALQPTFE